ncbi:MAG TPA: FAD-dependent oxidoreductase [Candidatus Saccharimonadales bacterium]|nr:FAD-dependent oxidoreductase [Candidatus Saccharimonadales bacterium]
MAESLVYDIVMIGAGPSALAAAVYTTREDLKTVMIEKGPVGGLAAITDLVDNYPGFPKGISGLELAQNFEAQAKRFGAAIEYGEVINIVDQGNTKKIITHDNQFIGKTVLIATGSAYKQLGVPGETEFYGRGVHYCATCDGAFYRDKKLVVVGGGNSAVQEALFLLKFATHIDMLVRNEVKASEVLQHDLSKAVQAGHITIHLNTATDEIVGKNNTVTKVRITKNGTPDEIITDGVFVFIGLVPNTGFLKNTDVQLDDRGFIKTDENLQTTVPGIFCSGDVRSGATMQIASAAGEGATAALKIREYLEMKERNHITPQDEKV